jgi:hypothetical protein
MTQFHSFELLSKLEIAFIWIILILGYLRMILQKLFEVPLFFGSIHLSILKRVDCLRGFIDLNFIRLILNILLVKYSVAVHLDRYGLQLRCWCYLIALIYI